MEINNSDKTFNFNFECTPNIQGSENIAVEYKTLKKGDSGEPVKNLQKRLIELKYLSGSADGKYEFKTEAAVELFQKANLIANVTYGVADSKTQERLFNSNTQVNPSLDFSSYQKMDYNAVARNPNKYIGIQFKFDGKVIQVIEDDDGSSAYRISTKGSYDNVVYATANFPKGGDRILEDDKVTVYATCTGLFSYQSTGGSKITIPSFKIDQMYYY